MNHNISNLRSPQVALHFSEGQIDMNQTSLLWLAFASLMIALASEAVVGAAAELPAGFTEATQALEKGTIHYVHGGKGEPVVLIHGFTDTSRMWRPILPVLAKEFTVITPDLPGLGGSSPMPSGVYDMKTVAQNLHDLVKHLGFTRIRLVGHDIGMMAAYAYAAQYPQEVQKLVLMDAPIPGI